MRSERSTSYRIFLLTVWQEDEHTLADPETLRFRLEDPKRGRRLGCVGVAAFVALLLNEMGMVELPGSDEEMTEDIES